MSNRPRDTLTIELYEQPGHLIRRAQQIAVSMFFDALGRDVTPVQYAHPAHVASADPSRRSAAVRWPSATVLSGSGQVMRCRPMLR